ncbi:Hypothetical predicted protein [Cloeon dipterum]|uniref:Uncharacterized protein n=1 Tax=Cloeon dipterum TaxID=197152 RepID=A0A8S1DIE2_9INSE|nr:Hypothetical predicted protein [Cloeon dipterum]
MREWLQKAINHNPRLRLCAALHAAAVGFKGVDGCRHYARFAEEKAAEKGSGGLVEMSLQKALCLVCECPTADGAVLADHVDKEKLHEWFLNVSGQELAEEIEDEDKICYFCLWHAELLWKFDQMVHEELVWWPRNSDHLDDAAKELRRNYFEGKLEQCFVQLEKIELPESDSEDDGRPSEAKKQTLSVTFENMQENSVQVWQVPENIQEEI